MPVYGQMTAVQNQKKRGDKKRFTKSGRFCFGKKLFKELLTFIKK